MTTLPKTEFLPIRTDAGSNVRPEPGASRGPVTQLANRSFRQTAGYRDYWAPVLAGLSQQLVQSIDPNGVERIVDVGTGVGALLPHIESAFPGANVFGIDRSRGMLGLAPDGSSLTQNDAARLPFPSRSTDLVLLPFMLFHLSDPREALLEARRVLRDAGHVGTATWSFGFDSVAERICDEELDRFGASKLEYDVTFTDHERVDSPSKMATLLESAGLHCRRSWVGIHEHRFDVEGLIGMRTQIGRSRRRFESLGSLRKDAFLTSVRRRLEALPVKDFIARAGVVYSTASVV